MQRKLDGGLKSSGGNLPDELMRVLRTGTLVLEVEDLEQENGFLRNRVNFMEQELPRLQDEVFALRALLERARRDRELLMEIVSKGNGGQND